MAHSSADEVDDDTSVVRASEQRSEGSAVPRTAPGMVNEPMTGISVPEPLEHSVLVVDLWRGCQLWNRSSIRFWT